MAVPIRGTRLECQMRLGGAGVRPRNRVSTRAYFVPPWQLAVSC